MEGFDNKNYAVDKVLRKRPHGNVYKAHRVSDGVLCAIKEIDVRHMSEEEKEDATEEIRVLATVHNENVISYYDAFFDESKLYVVMEYCDEPDLGRHIKTRAEHQKFFSEAQVWSYLIQMLRGLVAVHSRGLIHRDVRPGNIIQLDSHAVKIGDIRVGELLKEGPAATDIGNPESVSPEVWQNKAYTFKSDMWAVGCVLYEMITLAVPFGGCSLPDMRAKVMMGLYPPIPSSFSSDLSKVLKLLLNPDQATRISARELLLHPILQAHRHYAPAPAPMLRVQRSQERNKLASIIPAHSSIPMEPKSSYPTLVVPGDTQPLHGQTQDSKQRVSETPANRPQSGLSSERPTAPAARSRVALVLAPRAVLSSRDNDEMLADVNQPANQASKVKVPRVALLSKIVPKSPSETSVTSPLQGLPSTPSRVNMKHFKTAYIQTPKIDPDGFQVVSTPINHDRSDATSDVSRKEKIENHVVNARGSLKSKSVAALPPKVATTPRREKSTESLRSVGSSRSDDSSSIRVRAPIDALDPPSHTEFATPRRENSVESTKSVASCRSGESAAIRVRAPLDVSDAPQTNGTATHKGDSSKSVTSPASSHSNGSGISVRAPITEWDPAQPLVIADDVQPSLAGDELVIQEAPDSVNHSSVDVPELSQRLNKLTGGEPLLSDTSGSLAPTSRVSRTKSGTSSQISHNTENKNMPGSLDGVARRTMGTNVTVVKAVGDVSDKKLPSSRSRRLSFDGTGIERPLTGDHSKIATPRKESSSGVRKLAADNGGSIKRPIDSVTPSRTQGSGTDPSHVKRLVTGVQLPPNGARKTSQNGDFSGVTRRPLNVPAEDAKDLRGNSGSSSKSPSTVVQPKKKSSTQPPTTVTPISQVKRQGTISGNSGNSPAAVPAHSLQNQPVRSRRLSLDFPIKGKEVQPMGRGLGHITGAAR